MNWRRRIGSLTCVLFLSASFAESAEAERQVLRLRPVTPKAFYRPGESIAFELRCDPGVKGDVVVLFNPGEADEGGADHPPQECPYSRFPLVVPKHFVGDTGVSVLMVRAGQIVHSGRFDFEVRSDAKPTAFWIRDLSSPEEAASGDDACRPLSFYPGRAVPQRIPIYAILADGIRLDLCQESLASVRTDPATDFPIAIQNGSCTVTPRRTGSFRVTASFRGRTESWVCSVRVDDFPSSGREATPQTPPRVPPSPGSPMTVADFLADPTKLREHPTDVGNCRLLEHWTTGYCYIYSMRRGGKVSEPTDVRCGELAELRRRMKAAIERGQCDDRPASPPRRGSGAASSVSGPPVASAGS